MEHKVLVVAGPAGAGKNTIINEILKRVENSADLVTSTTRAKRVGEVDGVDYYFLTNEEFEKKLEEGKVFGEYFRESINSWYGILRDKLEEQISKYDLVLGDIQIVGTKALKQNYNATTVFILPESYEIMERRVRSRSPMSDAEWAERLEHTKREVEEDMPFYDYTVENKDGELEVAVEKILEILKKEGFKIVPKKT